MANSLKLGCDCVGTIHYFDAHMVNMAGEAETIENAVCMHEEDYGTLWKHTDWRTNHCEVRRSRRLVISFFATVGNYDYGFSGTCIRVAKYSSKLSLPDVCRSAPIRQERNQPMAR